MSLGGALYIGRSGLLAHQAATEVTGDNLANQATEGFHRRRIALEPIRDGQIQPGLFVGRGVQIQSITRQVDAALEGRIRANIADMAGSQVRSEILGQIEALHNEFSDADLSSYLSQFFNAWSELANRPQDNALRSLVLRQGSTVAGFLNGVRSQLTSVRAQVDQSIDAAVAAVNDLLEQLETVNGQIVAGGGGRDGTLALHDSRDLLLERLAEQLDISAIERESGAIDVFVGSIPLLLDGRSRGVVVQREPEGDELRTRLAIREDGTPLPAASGRIGALVAARAADSQFALDQLDAFARTLIFEVNRVHSQGQGLGGFDDLTAANRVLDADALLGSEESGLGMRPGHGSFQLSLTQRSTQLRRATTIQVDLDGIDADRDTTLTSLAAAIDAVENVSAQIGADGRLRIRTDSSDFEFSFSEDSSGVLAALGLNCFFVGSDAGDIAVDPAVNAAPGRLAASRAHHAGDNANALALATLADQPLASLDGLSLPEAWARHVEDVATRLGQARQQLDAESIVNDNLRAQQQAISGVNSDEEVINLLAYQRAYQGSARFLSVVDELLQTLLSLL